VCVHICNSIHIFVYNPLRCLCNSAPRTKTRIVEYGEKVWTKQGGERGKWGGDRGRAAGGGQVLPLELQNVIRVAK